MDITTEYITLAFFDGAYANNLDAIQFTEEFDLTIAETDVKGNVITYTSNYTSIKGSLFRFKNWDMIAKKECTFDVALKKSMNRQALTDSNSVYTLHIADNVGAFNKCLEDGTSLSIKATEMDTASLSSYTAKVRLFTLLSIFIMILTICNYDSELVRFEELFQARVFNVESHGAIQVSYASKFSYLSSCALFLSNFSLFMFYFQLSMMGVFQQGSMF